MRDEAFEHVSGAAVLRLLDYQYRAIDRVRALAADFAWIASEDAPPPIRYTAGVECACELVTVRLRDYSRLAVAPWWVAFMRRAGEALERDVHESVVLSARLITPAVLEAAVCKGCGPRAAAALDKFTVAFAEKIASVISEVGTLSWVPCW